MKKTLLGLILAALALSPALAVGSSGPYRGRCNPLIHEAMAGLSKVSDNGVRQKIFDAIVAADTQRRSQHYEACVTAIREVLQTIERNS